VPGAVPVRPAVPRRAVPRQAARQISVRQVGRRLDAGRPGGSPRPGSLRLTRRGRVVLVALAAALILAAGVLLAAAGAQAANGGAAPAVAERGMTRVTVMPGQTLWSIAMRAAPASDPRVVVQRIVDDNALRSTAIQPGERLWVPEG
jgi:LysM domain